MHTSLRVFLVYLNYSFLLWIQLRIFYHCIPPNRVNYGSYLTQAAMLPLFWFDLNIFFLQKDSISIWFTWIFFKRLDPIRLIWVKIESNLTHDAWVKHSLSQENNILHHGTLNTRSMRSHWHLLRYRGGMERGDTDERCKRRFEKGESEMEEMIKEECKHTRSIR